MTQQYFDKEQLKDLVAISDFKGFQPVSTDSYSDGEILKTIMAKGGMKMLLFCAIQTAVVGSGNKVFGEFIMNGETINVKTIYKEFDVRDDLSLQSKIDPGELTPRRLQCFYRVQINEYLLQNPDIAPYLWKKFSTLKEEFRAITFPGAESLVANKEEGLYLLETYKTLDNRLDLNIAERIRRVLLARGIITIQDIVE
ncbi:hypothetical protein [Streptomyces natalensis]|uniref:Uncharacterized protein n=1 Tax=Streptomyces natalensis ATCC 27448 TaxID=1240678 RepID=A0A0D7CGQ7_9ACTN|nr:hypothetical protein [Streptomyces natalensis]KIZ15055.1 hypothetical protein SNA_29480 [Streptomyces natalensis ATCC 27448]